MHGPLDVVTLVALVAAVAALARRIGLLSPILLLLAGIGLSFVPFVPDYTLDPELILYGILPLLLHAAAVETSLPDFRANLRPIGLLAVGLVIFTTAVVGLVLHAVVPSLPLVAAFALGAVVAPPDAVAATAIARRVGLPRRVVTILEGESLVNDATALVTLRVAVAAATGESLTWLEAGWDLFVAAVGGVLVGALVGRAVAWLHRRIEDPLLDNTLTVLTPFAAFVPAERFHASGVVAVVVAGLYIGHRLPTLLTPASRLQAGAFWGQVQFLLEGAVFLLVGLQVRAIVAGLGKSAEAQSLTPSTVVLASVAVVLTVVGARMVWIYPATYLARMIPRVRRNDPSPPLRYPTVIGWAGMRGVVTLAAASSLAAGFPARDLLLWLAFVVVAATLLLQGTTLAPLARALKVPADDPTVDALAAAEVRAEARRAAESRLEQLAAADGLPSAVLERLRARTETLDDHAWERLGTSGESPTHAYARARRAMVAAEREVLVRARDDGRIPERILSNMQRDLDLEEALLVAEDDDEPVGSAATPTRDSCKHLARAGSGEDLVPAGPAQCEECLAEGRDDWVSLRLCLRCGHVGCCDSSPLRHATGHFEGVRHPVMRSIQDEETWRWCYVDEVVG